MSNTNMVQHWSEQEIALLKQNLDTSIEEVKKLFPDRSFNSVHVKWKRLRKARNHHEVIQKDTQKIHQQIAEKELSNKYKGSLLALHSAQKTIENLTQIKNGMTTYSISQTPGIKSEATAFMVASDWHMEEEVNPKKIQGLNKFTLKIAEDRANKFFSNGLRLVNISQKDVQIKNIVLALIGDFISGSIHEELLEQNQLGPMDAIIFVNNILCGGIEFLLKNTDCDITIPCVVGNHSRITEKTRMTMENEHSLEYLMFCLMAQRFKENKRVKFLVSEGDILYMDVYNKKVRFIHGHQVKFGGGVGGITIPLLKYIQRQDQIIKADYTVLGHFHNMLDGGRFILNGCLIGYNAYAQRIGASFETPRQAFFLVDKNRGKTIVAPIFVD